MGHLNSHAEVGSLSAGSRGHSAWRTSHARALFFPLLHVRSSSFFRARSVHIIAINSNKRSATIQPLPGGTDPFLRTGAIPISRDSACSSRRSLYLPRLTELITMCPHCPCPLRARAHGLLSQQNQSQRPRANPRLSVPFSENLRALTAFSLSM